MNKVLFYEFFLQQFDELQNKQSDLLEQLRRGHSYIVIAQQLSELEVRMNQTEYIYQKLKVWFL